MEWFWFLPSLLFQFVKNKYKKNILNCVQHKVGSRDEAPINYRSMSSKGAGWPCLTHHHKGWWNKTKWMRWEWRNGGMKFVVEKPREKPTQTPVCPPQNPHGGTETQTRDPSSGRRAPNRLRHSWVLIILLQTKKTVFLFESFTYYIFFVSSLCLTTLTCGPDDAYHLS